MAIGYSNFISKPGKILAVASGRGRETQTVLTQPGPIQLTLPLGAIFTISFLSDIVRPYIMAREKRLNVP